jgi:hypothetical protein
MAQSAQRRAVAGYRRRQAERGIGRFEVQGLNSDKQLVRQLAARLAVDDAGAQRLRAELERTVVGEPSSHGGIFAALRRSPMVGVNLDLKREETEGRDLDLWRAT